MRNKLITWLALVIFTLFLFACKAKKSIEKSTGAVEITVPFTDKEYQSDKDFFRAKMSGKSPDIAAARKIAIENSRATLAADIQTVVKVVSDQYTKQVTVSDNQDFENKFEEMIRTVVNESISFTKIIGEKLYQEKDGKYTCWVVIEMPKEQIINSAFDKISKDDKMKVDFDKYKYQQIFDKEMEKFEKEN
jgi:hypothetical protein